MNPHNAPTRGGVTETELAAKASGERVTLEQVEATIASEHYFTAGEAVTFSRCLAGERSGFERQDGKYRPVLTPPVPASLSVLTFCVLELTNGYTVHGISACADPANYNQEIGERIARANAVNQIWPLLGYELKTKLHKEAN